MMFEKYDRLVEQEASYWGRVRPDPENPQLWHDDHLFEIFFGNEYRYFLHRIERAGTELLELGCGEGHLSLLLAQRGKRVTAIDLSMERIERAGKSAAFLAHPPLFSVGDLNTIILPPNRYDCVISHDALHHIYALDHLLDQVHASLRRGGKFIILDFIGMGRLRKMLAAMLYAVLPTYKPYRKKWRLRKRLSSFLATEEQRRNALLQDHSERALHPDSPFEEISQSSILRSVQERFAIREYRSFNPFWYYLAPKLRVKSRIRYAIARAFRSMDDMLVRSGLARGAYVFLEAEKL